MKKQQAQTVTTDPIRLRQNSVELDGNWKKERKKEKINTK